MKSINFERLVLKLHHFLIETKKNQLFDRELSICLVILLNFGTNKFETLTELLHEKVYGTAITFYEEYDEAMLTEEQKTKLNLSGSKWSRTRCAI